jgi:hypothetical protein
MARLIVILKRPRNAAIFCIALVFVCGAFYFAATFVLFAGGCPVEGVDVAPSYSSIAVKELEDVIVQDIEQSELERLPVYHVTAFRIGAPILRTWNQSELSGSNKGTSFSFTITSVESTVACVSVLKEQRFSSNHISGEVRRWSLIKVLGKWLVFKSITPDEIFSG